MSSEYGRFITREVWRLPFLESIEVFTYPFLVAGFFSWGIRRRAFIRALGVEHAVLIAGERAVSGAWGVGAPYWTENASFVQPVVPARGGSFVFLTANSC